jgi:hypothetical protein
VAEERRLLAISCSEPAVFAAVGAVIGDRAGALPVERIAIPGGPWWVARAASANEGRVKRFITGSLVPMEELARRFLGDTTLAEVVLIAHQGCRWYRDADRRATAGELVRKQGEDLYRAAAEVRRWAPSDTRVSGIILLAGPGGLESRVLF